MAATKGQLVFGTLVKPSMSDFPIVDSNDVKGGRHFVNSLVERNNIAASHRIAGMVVYVGGSVKKDFILKAGFPTTGTTTDANWEEYSPGAPEGGFLTAHQKVEDIEYQVAYEAGKYKLTQKLDDIDTALDNKLEQHQKLEDIVYQTPVTSSTGQNITTLQQKLADIDSQLGAAGAEKFIEDIKYQNTPTGHQTYLADELASMWDTMNDPTKIMITNDDFTKTSLQDKIAALANSIPYATDIPTSALDSTKVTAYLTNASNAITTIKYDSTTTLKDKIDSIASAAGAVSIENIKWTTTPASVAGGLSRDQDLGDELNNLFNKIADQNDPTKITIPATVTGGTADTLNGFLTTLKGMITSAGAQTIEQIQWNSTPSGSNRNQQLSTELNTLFTAIANMNDPTQINIPASVTGSAGNLIQILTALKAANDSTASSITTIQNTVDSLGGSVSNLTTTVNSYGTTIESIQGGMSTLQTNVTNMESSVTNMQTSITNITSGDITVPQILLFNTSSPAEGALESQEFLTNNSMKIKEITVYTNSAATISGNIQVNLQSSVGAGAYTDINGTTVALASTDAGKLKVSDISASGITVAANTRIRMNVASLGGSSPELLNVRVILVPSTSA